MLLRQLFSVVGCDDSPAAAPLPQIDDAPAMLPLDLNAFYVDKELLQRKGYRTVRDLYNDGVRNQEDLRSLCLKLRDERKKEEQLRNFSDMATGAAIVVATSLLVYAYGRRSKSHQDLQSLVLRLASRHPRAAPLMKGTPMAVGKLDGAIRQPRANGSTAFDAPGARGKLLFDATHTGSQWVVDALTLQLAEVLDSRSGYFVPTSRSLLLVPDETAASSKGGEGAPAAAAEEEEGKKGQQQNE